MRSRTTLLLAFLSLASCSRADPGSEPFLNKKPDLELCRADPAFQKIRFDGWEPGAPAIDVRFLAKAPKPCPARRFPFIDVAATAPLRWIQIVEVNVPIPLGSEKKPSASWQLVSGDEPWVFADMVPERRDSGEPFVTASTDGTFWDNPAWPEPPKQDQRDGERRWRSRSYAVVAEGKDIRAVAAFTWGWTWKVGEPNPEAVTPAALDAAAWKTDAERLAKAFQGWTFR